MRHKKLTSLYYWLFLIVSIVHVGIIWSTRTPMASISNKASTKASSLNLKLKIQAKETQKKKQKVKKEIKKKLAKKKKKVLKKRPEPIKEQKSSSESSKLPVPVAEYLISQMPQLKSEHKISYPERAKKMGIEGTVVLNILIDEYGKVRDAKILEGLIKDLNRAALNAIKKYRFSPAIKDGKSVAVRVRYGISFEIENN